MAAPAENGAPDQPAATQTAEEKAANAPGESLHSMLFLPVRSQCMLWQGQILGDLARAIDLMKNRCIYPSGLSRCCTAG